MTDIKDKLANLNTKPADVKEPEEKVYQMYASSRSSVRLITDAGIRINFVKFQYLTAQEDVIEYLDSQIKLNALPGITKGKCTTLADLDPMTKLRKELKAELKAELEEEAKNKALGVSRDMGSTESKAQIKVAGTDTVAS